MGVYFYGARGVDDERQRQILAAQLMGQGIQQFGALRDQQKQRDALGNLLAGTPQQPGAGLENLTRKGAPGMNPALAGPSLALTQGGMAKPAVPGMLETGKLTPQMAQAFMLQGGDPRALMAMMPEPDKPFTGTAGPGEQIWQGGRPIGEVPAEAKPPQMRDRLEGDRRVFEQFDPATGQWTPLSQGPAFAPPTQITVDTGGIKVPQGYMLNPNDPAGQTVVPIPGGPAEEVTGTGAAAMALGPGALADIPKLETALFNPDGSLNRQAIFNMNVPGVGAAMPNTAGVDLRQTIEAGIEAILRPISGATIPPEERQARRDMYMPSVTDTLEVARNKLLRYRRDLEGSIGTASRGRGALPGAEAIPEAAQPGLMDQVIQGVTGQVQQFMGGGGQAQAAPAIPPATGMGFPPVEQRQAGQVYTNSQGVKGRWTGQGWEVVQ